MGYITTIGYHDAYFELEVIVSKNSKTKNEAEKLGNHKDLNDAFFYNDKIVVGNGEKEFAISEEETNSYQFRVCRLTEEEINKKGNMVSDKDYQNITWDEAIEYFHKEYKNLSLPFHLEGYYYAVYESEKEFRNKKVGM